MDSNFISPAMREAMINLIERLDEKDADLLASLFHRIADDNDAMIAEVVRRAYNRAIEDAAKVAECWPELWDVAASIRALVKED